MLNKDMICAYIEKATDQKCMDIDKVLRLWRENKSATFGKMFSNSLILKRTFKQKMSLQSFSMLYKDGEQSVDFFWKLRNRIYNSDIRYKMKELNGTNHTYANFYDDFLADPDQNIYNTYYKGDPFYLCFPDDTKMKVCRGTKYSRVYGKLAAKFGLEKEWKDCNDYFSKVFTMKDVSGTACLSIHPLDFMTMSDNEEGWHSCMSWKRDDYDDEIGAQRAGTIEMMNSRFVVVGYIEAENNRLKFSNYEWNSKVWRNLFIVDPTRVITSIHSYPVANTELDLFFVNWLREYFDGFTEPKLIASRFDYFNGVLGFRFRTGVMYNDTYRRPMTVSVNEKFLEGITERSETIVDYSGPMNCMVCGDTFSLVEDECRGSETLCCREHDLAYEPTYCHYCGEEISPNSAMFALNNELVYLCEGCEEKHTMTALTLSGVSTLLTENVQYAKYNGIEIPVAEGVARRCYKTKDGELILVEGNLYEYARKGLKYFVDKC